MKSAAQLKMKKSRYKRFHEKEFKTVLDEIRELMPDSSTVDGFIDKTGDTYEGRILIKSKIGDFVARAKSRVLLDVISSLEEKSKRQIVNWKEKKRDIARYHDRRAENTNED